LSKQPLPPYEHWPIVDRPPIEWPEGRKLAGYVALNVEHFEIGKPSTSRTQVTASLPVDPLNFGWRDYGVRVGFWRLLELFDELDLRATVLLNGAVLDNYPELVRAGVTRDWAHVAHGWTNSDLWTGLDPDTERRSLRELRDAMTAACGRPPRGWLGPALTETAATLPLLAELGFTYSLGWGTADDQPFPLRTAAESPMIGIPYSIEVNDIPVFVDQGMGAREFGRMIVDQLEVLRREAGRRPGAVFSFSLHPFLVGQPYRFKYLEAAMREIRAHDDIWFTTTDEIAAWYLDHHHSDALAALTRSQKGRA
jgi:allantoinase